MKMKSIFLVSVLVALSGCEKLEGYVKNFEKSFKSSYKESFVGACAKPEDGDAKNRICTCMADELIDNFSITELRDEDAMIKYVQEVAVTKCLSEQSDET